MALVSQFMGCYTAFCGSQMDPVYHIIHNNLSKPAVSHALPSVYIRLKTLVLVSYLNCTGGLGNVTLVKRPLGFTANSILFSVTKGHLPVLITPFISGFFGVKHNQTYLYIIS